MRLRQKNGLLIKKTCSANRYRCKLLRVSSYKHAIEKYQINKLCESKQPTTYKF